MQSDGRQCRMKSERGNVGCSQMGGKVGCSQMGGKVECSQREVR